MYLASLNILLVEDNDGDILLATEALEKSRFNCKVSVAKDGLEAVHFLERAEPGLEMPQLVILDINLPKMNGHEVLDYIRSGKFSMLPVVIYSTSAFDRETILAHSNPLNCYLTKPSDTNGILSLASAIDDFWISASEQNKMTG